VANRYKFNCGESLLNCFNCGKLLCGESLHYPSICLMFVGWLVCHYNTIRPSVVFTIS